MVANPTRLTELTDCAGCAGKVGPATLAQVLRFLSENGPASQDANLLVGLATPDDAAVYRLNDEQAVVLTLDFFAPLVDDPRDYGAIAAANAMSDVYATGGEVLLALNIAAFPKHLAPEVIADILQGGADKVAEAGGVIVGGHTITDHEPKYGLSVMGIVHPQRVLTKGGARLGDVLYLTKPLGTGIITTAGKLGEAEAGHLEAAIQGMKQLNRHPSHIVREVGAHCLTDVTGFGLMGHAYEMVAATAAAGNGVAFRIVASRLPLLDGALAYAAQGITTGGEVRNRTYLEGKVRIQDGISDELKTVLYDPQTSGGLLFSVEPERAASLERRFAESGLDLWSIGEVVVGEGVEVVP